MTRRAFSKSGHRARRPSRRAFFERLEDRSLLAAITVNSALDTDSRDSVLTLREAILVNNRSLSVGSLTTAERALVSGTPSSGDSDTIRFNIPGGGVRTITPGTNLPMITDPVTIDGYTQPGASENTNSLVMGTGAVGSNAVLTVQISAASAGGDGLIINADNTTIRGLAINGFGIQVRALTGTTGHSGIVIEGNFLGVDPTGMQAAGTSTIGVHFANSTTNSRIGGTTLAARNVIAGYSLSGVQLEQTSGVLVQGNFIGANAAGTAAVGRGSYGVYLLTSRGNNVIGGTAVGAGNLIGGSDEGLHTGNGPGGAPTGADRIQGNFIGTNVTGNNRITNRVGLRLASSAGGLIGGTDGEDGTTDGVVRARNVISGNEQHGVLIGGGGFTIQGNFVGTDVTGALPLGNGSSGIASLTRFDNTLIGGTVATAGNTIAYNGFRNGGDGVFVPEGFGNGILGNSIFANTDLGIDLQGFIGESSPGVTANDPNDGDSGPNNLQNFPEITSARLTDASLTVQYTVRTTPANASYPLRVEFFKADANGQEGETFLGSDVYSDLEAGATATFTFTPLAAVALGERIIATASDSGNNTSEFSASVGVVSGNRPPTAVNDTGSISEDLVLAVAATGVLANDTDPDASDSKTVVAVNGSAANVGQTITLPSGALLRLLSNGSYQYDPNGKFDFLPAGNSTTDSFVYTMADAGGAASSATVTITVQGANDAPRAANDFASVGENGVLDVPAAIGVLENDTDPDTGDTEVVAAVNGVTANVGQQVILASGARVRMLADGSYRYNPLGSFESLGAGQTATDSFTYDVADAAGVRSTATVTITIQGENDAPVARDDSFDTLENTSRTITRAEYLANDTDVDSTSNSLTGTIVTQPEHGSVSPRLDGSFVYTPTTNYSGPDRFTYRISDGAAFSNNATIFLNVIAVNEAPVVSVGGNLPVAEGTAFSRSGSFADDDAGDSWTATVDYGDGSGTQPLPLQPNKTFQLSRAYADNGNYTVTVSVRDSTNRVGTASFQAIVTNAPPQILSWSGPATAAAGQSLAFVGTFSDPGTADTHTATIDWGDGQSSPATITRVGANWQVNATHTYAAAGSYVATLRVTDDDGDSATQATSVSFAGVGRVADVLEIVGTGQRDHFRLSLSGKNLVIRGQLGSKSVLQSVPFTGLLKVVASLGDGNDSLTIESTVKVPVLVNAGNGNDIIIAGGGPTVQIGGLGQDQLSGNGKGDLLLAGTTSYDNNLAALNAILTEWTSTRSFTERTNNLRNGTGPVLSGSNIRLRPNETVFNDASVDTLFGGSDQDWFLFDTLRDKGKDKAELVN